MGRFWGREAWHTELIRAQRVKGKEDKMRLKREEGTDDAVCIGYPRACAKSMG